jgi:predicted small lipoprotein YifL
MPARTRYILLAAVSLTAAACGLKGPLYQPDAPQAQAPNGESVQPTAEDPASTTKKKDPGGIAPPDPDRPAVPPKH